MFKKLIIGILVISVAFGFCGCLSENVESGLEEVSDDAKIMSIINTSELQYPDTNDLFYYNVYDKYVAITKYIGEDLYIQGESGLSIPKYVKVPDLIDGLPVYVIGESAFKGALIESVEISKNVTIIEPSAFQNCENLKTVTFTDVIDTADGVVNGKGVVLFEDKVFQGCKLLQSIVLDDSVMEIGPSMFYQCESLTEINVPNQVTQIPSFFCAGCSSLSDIYIADSVTDINSSAFSDVSENAKIHGGVYSVAAQYAANHFLLFVIDSEAKPAE